MRRKQWTIGIAALVILAVLFSACSNSAKDWQEQYDLGMRYLSEGDYEEAILAFSTAIEIDDSRPEAYIGRAEAYIGIGKPEEALDDYRRARKIARENDDEDLVEELEEVIDELEEILKNQDEVVEEHDPDAENRHDWNFQITVTDAYSDYITGDYYGEYAYCYHIPQINLKGDLAAAANQEIYDTLIARLEESVYSTLHDYGYPSVGYLAYRWGMKDDVLSVVVEENGAEYHWTAFYVYNVSIWTGQLISDEEMLMACGLDIVGFRSLAAEVLAKHFEEQYTQRDIESMGRDFYNDLVADTLSEENLAEIRPFVGENGNLCMTAGVYCPAGAGYYLYSFDLEQQVMLETVWCTVDHTVAEETPVGYSPEEITRMVAEWYNANVSAQTGYGYTAFESETYIENGKWIITIRFDDSGSNTRVDTAMVDMITGELWADGQYLCDLW